MKRKEKALTPKEKYLAIAAKFDTIRKSDVTDDGDWNGYKFEQRPAANVRRRIQEYRNHPCYENCLQAIGEMSRVLRDGDYECVMAATFKMYNEQKSAGYFRMRMAIAEMKVARMSEDAVAAMMAKEKVLRKVAEMNSEAMIR